MGLVRKFASIMMLGGVSSHSRHEPPGNRAKSERAQEKPRRPRPCRSGHQAPDSGWQHLGPVAGLAPPSVGLNRFF